MLLEGAGPRVCIIMTLKMDSQITYNAMELDV